MVEESDLGWVLLEVLDVFREPGELLERHTALDPALHGRQLVVPEVDPARGAEQAEDPLELLVVEDEAVSGLRGPRLPQVRVAGDLHELGGDLRWREDEIDHPGGDGGARHAVVLRGLGHLGDGDAAHCLDLAHADGPVRCRPGEDHADRPVLRGVSERAEEEVDRRVLRAVTGAGGQVQLAVRDPHLHVGGNHVHVPRLDMHSVGHLVHQEPRLRAEEARQRALVLRRQVLHEDQRKVRVVRKRLQELRERLEPAGRGADADDRRLRGGLRLGEGGAGDSRCPRLNRPPLPHARFPLRSLHAHSPQSRRRQSLGVGLSHDRSSRHVRGRADDADVVPNSHPIPWHRPTTRGPALIR